jgi:hypothetical protein
MERCDHALMKMSRPMEERADVPNDGMQKALRLPLRRFFIGIAMTLHAVRFESREPIGPHRFVQEMGAGVRYIRGGGIDGLVHGFTSDSLPIIFL